MMSIFNKRTKISNSSDAALVIASLGGDRDAFCEVVSRYQNLLWAPPEIGFKIHKSDWSEPIIKKF